MAVRADGESEYIPLHSQIRIMVVCRFWKLPLFLELLLATRT
jgi:hypothetical protein